MNISQQNASRLEELQQEIEERLNEFKEICRRAMTPSEYDQFRYRTLAHIEPGVSLDSPWVNQGELDPLDKIAERALDDATVEEEENEEA